MIDIEPLVSYKDWAIVKCKERGYVHVLYHVVDHPGHDGEVFSYSGGDISNQTKGAITVDYVCIMCNKHIPPEILTHLKNAYKLGYTMCEDNWPAS